MRRFARFLHRLIRRVLVTLVVVWMGAFFFFNDERLGWFVSKMVTGSVRGTFALRRIHYPFWGGLWSALTDRPTTVYGEDFRMLDPDGNLAMRVDGVETEVKLRTLLASLLRSPLERRLVLTLEFQNARAPRAMAIIAPTRSTWGKSPSEVNVPAAMSGKGPPGGGSNLTIRVDGIDIETVDFGLAFADAAGKPAWSAALNNAKVHASLLYKSARELDTKEGPFLFFEVGPVTAPSGDLRIGETFHFPLEDIAVAQFGSQLPGRGDLAFSAAVKSRQSSAAIDGALLGVFTGQGGAKLDIHATEGNGILRQLPQPIGRWLYGPAIASLHIEGPFSKVLFDGQIAGALGNLEGLAMKNIASGFHMECGRLEFPKLAADAGGGKVTGTIRVQLPGAPPPKKKKLTVKNQKIVDDNGCPVPGKPEWSADLKLDGVDPDKIPWVPRNVAPDVAGRLSGSMRLGGSLVEHPETIRIEAIDAVLERRIAKLLPKRLRLGGGFRYSPGMMRLDDLSASAEGLRVAVLGEVNPKTLAMSGRARIDGAADGAWVRRLWGDTRLRPGKLASSGRIGGSLDRPEMELDVELEDWSYRGRKLDRLQARLRLVEGELVADQMSGRLYGGLLSGDIGVRLFTDAAIKHALQQPTLRVGIGITGAGAKGLLGAGFVDGQVDLDMRLSGTVRSPYGAAEAQIRGLTILGDAYSRAQVRAELGDGILKVRDLELRRKEGGALLGSGDFGSDGALAGEVNLEPTPLSAIPGIAKLPWALVGLISAAVTIGGTLDDPRFGGTITLDETTLRKVGLGTGSLTLAPGNGKIGVRGRVWDRLQVEGEVRLAPIFGAHFSIRFVDLALEGIVPELKSMASTHGVVSGELLVDYSALGNTLDMRLNLDKVDMLVDAQSDDETGRVLAVKNQGAIQLRSDGARVQILQCDLRSALGSVRLAGLIDQEASRLEVRGRLGLELAQYFVRGIFNHVSGDADVDLRLEGPLRQPRFHGAVDVAKVEIEPRGLEHHIKLPSGHIQFTGERVLVDQLKVVLDGQELGVKGQVRLAGLDIKELGLALKGRLSAKLLTWLLPDQIGESRGGASVDLQVTGTPKLPQLRGKAEFADMTMELRKLYRELKIAGGTALFTPDGEIVIGCPKSGGAPEGCTQVTGLFDSETQFFVDGRLRWLGFDAPDPIDHVDVTAEMRGFNYSTAEYQVTFSPRVRLRSVGKGLELSGRIDVIDGRYIRPYDIFRDAVIRPRVVEKSVPFWQGVPMLEQIKLQLAVQSTPGTLIVKNNLAELSLSAYLDIAGTLADPRVDGTIQLEEGGSFKPPGLRAEFVTNRGQVMFDASKVLGEDTPRIDLSATAEMLDRGDVTHSILAKFTGTVSKPTFQLTSLDGWDMSTTLAFLLAGRTPDDIRRSLQGSDPTVRVSGAASSSGADGLTKSASGVLIGNLLNPLKGTIGLDIASIEVGTKSVDIRLCKRFGRWIKMCGAGEIGFLGSSRLDARGELKLLDPLLLMLRVEYLTRGVETLQEVQSRLKFELNWRFPLGY